MPGDNFVYVANYTTNKWTGDIQAHQLDVVTGDVSATVDWSAQSLLDAKTGNACDNRKIYLLHPGAIDNMVNFSWNTFPCDVSGQPTGSADTGLNAAEKDNFGALNVSLMSQYPQMTDGTAGTADQRSPAAGANLVNFLRGQRGLENFTVNDAGKLYRQREHVLGDIVDGQPVYVKAPFATYQDAGYSGFKAGAASLRKPMVYAPGNDGMLHAFYAAAQPDRSRARARGVGADPERGAAEPVEACGRELPEQPPVVRGRNADGGGCVRRDQHDVEDGAGGGALGSVARATTRWT